MLYLVFLKQYPGHRYVSISNSIHERSDPTAVRVVWAVATSGRSVNRRIHQHLGQTCVQSAIYFLTLFAGLDLFLLFNAVIRTDV